MGHEDPETVTGLFQLLEQNLADIADSLSRALGGQYRLEIAPASQQEAELAGHQPGVRIRIQAGEKGLWLFLPEGSYLPPDYTDPSPTWRARWGTLAQELAVILFPDCLEAGTSYEIVGQSPSQGALVPEAAGLLARFRVLSTQGEPIGVILVGETQGSVEHKRSQLPEKEHGELPEDLTPEGSSEKIGPSHSDNVSLEAGRPATQEAGKSSSLTHSADPHTREDPGPSREKKLKDLPPYLRGLLRVPLRLSVTLARRKQPVGQILQLTPGAILQFDKSCEEPLELEVAGRVIAQGEAVKVGEVFGLRILRLIPPPERFVSLRPKQQNPSPNSGHT